MSCGTHLTSMASHAVSSGLADFGALTGLEESLTVRRPALQSGGRFWTGEAGYACRHRLTTEAEVNRPAFVRSTMPASSPSRAQPALLQETVQRRRPARPYLYGRRNRAGLRLGTGSSRSTLDL